MGDFKYIDKCGLEVEAGWLKKRNDLIPDASLKPAEFNNSDCFGELVTKKPLESKAEILDWFEKNKWDDAPHCCSIHIHTSFKSIIYYSNCMEENFYAGFLKAMKEWGENYPCTNETFWERLNGKNKYCVKDFRPDKQIKCKTKEESRLDDLRRTQLNYCFGIYKTLENRLFPCFKNYKTAQSATLAYLDYIENYLEKHQKGIQEVILEIMDDEPVQSQLKSSLKLKPFNYFARRNNLKRVNELKNEDDSILIKKSNLFPNVKELKNLAKELKTLPKDLSKEYAVQYIVTNDGIPILKEDEVF